MVVGTMHVSSMEQDLSLGPPSVKALDDGQYEVQFRLSPHGKSRGGLPGGQLQRLEARRPARWKGPTPAGRYSARVQLMPGDYQYKFVLDGKHWRADPGNPDLAGQHQNNLLHVGAGN